VILTVLIALAIAFAVWRLFLGYPRHERAFSHLRPGEVAFLDAAAEAMFPAGGAIAISGRDADLPRYVDRYFETLHGAKRTQIRLLLLFIEQSTAIFPAPGPRGRRRFSALSAEQREAVLRDWSGSGLYLRRLLFTALRAVLTMGYLGHPAAMRQLRLAPHDFPTPIVEADLLYPRIGRHPDTIPYTRADLSGPPDGTPIDLDGPLHPDYAEKPL
jgi:hypothetical protein